MKVLLLMRHAKSSWGDPTIKDHDRPLNNRGKKDAPRMGKLLKENNLIPDIILSSTAKRAEMTQSLANILKILYLNRRYIQLALLFSLRN